MRYNYASLPIEFWIALIIGGIIGIIINTFFLLNLQNALKAVSPENRKMPPANVWLSFIPIFNLGWQFYVVRCIADSLELEFQKRNIVIEEARPGYSIGIAYGVLFCCGIIPILGRLASLAGLICWIVYWVKISKYKNQLLNGPSTFSEGHSNVIDQM